MNEEEGRQLAAEMIAVSLKRLKEQELLNDLHRLGDLIEAARAEASSAASS